MKTPEQDYNNIISEIFLKPCPFCGNIEDLAFGSVKAPDAFWDSGMRGEEYVYIQCLNCNFIMKENDFGDLFKVWNTRKETKG